MINFRKICTNAAVCGICEATGIDLDSGENMTINQIDKLRRKIIIMLILLIILIAAAIRIATKFLISSSAAEISQDTLLQYESILTDEEKEEWQNNKIYPNKVYLQLNTRIDVINGYMANIRLINPAYCQYNLKFTVTLEDETDPIYESALISPGTVLEYIIFPKNLESGEHNGIVSYEFYNDKDEVIAEKEVNVIFQ